MGMRNKTLSLRPLRIGGQKGGKVVSLIISAYLFPSLFLGVQAWGS